MVTAVDDGGRACEVLYDDGDREALSTLDSVCCRRRRRLPSYAPPPQLVEAAPPPREAWPGVFIFENLKAMELQWLDRIDAHLGCASTVHEATASAAARSRRFRQTPFPPGAEALPPHLTPVRRLDLPSLIGKGTGRMFAAWLARRRLPIMHMQFGAVTRLSSVGFAQTLSRIGGAHLVVGGSPCNNLSGRCARAGWRDSRAD